MAAGKFEVYQDKSHKWRWRLKDDQGHTVATSPIRPAHDTADQARAAVQAVQDAQREAAVETLDP